MTKLEQKLIELDYKKWLLGNDDIQYYHKLTDEVEIEIHIKNGTILNYYVYQRRSIFKQEQIDNLQQAFNQLQSDLKELNQIENE